MSSNADFIKIRPWVVFPRNDNLTLRQDAASAKCKAEGRQPKGLPKGKGNAQKNHN